MIARGVSFSRLEFFRALLLGVAAVLVTSLAGLHCDAGFPRIAARYGFRTNETFHAGWVFLESGEIREFESPDIRTFRPGDDPTDLDKKILEFSKEYRETAWASEARQWAFYDEYARGFPLQVVSYRVLISKPTGHHENVDPDQVRTFPEYRHFQIRWVGLGLNVVLWASLYLVCITVVRSHRRKWWKRHGCCLNCGYSLHANISGACPECGAVIPVIPRVAAMIALIKQAYRDLDRPNYSFQERALKTLRSHPLVTEIQNEYPAKDITDLNNHQAMHLQIDDPPAVILCLSLVGPWAMVFRIVPGELIYERVLDGEASELSPLEARILSLLEQHGFTVMTREEAATPIKMNLFSTDRSDVRLYHALISDDGVIPAVLDD